MGINTIGIIGIENKDVFAVYRAVKKVLSTFDDNKTQKWDFASKKADIYANFELKDGYFAARFVDGDDYRTLFVFFNCDFDYKEDFPGSKIIFSLGCWGRSVFLIESILKELAGGWMIDCDTGDNWRKIE